MPRIKWIEEAEATGDIAQVYQEYTQSKQRDYIPEVLKCFSLRPDFFREILQASETVHFSDGHLDRRTKEMIATYVSAINRCPY
ncbi:MAG: carboxymuconolactone decarboxylase family protein [Gemmataceae bacterium]